MKPDGDLLNRLRAVVGKRHVLTGLRRTARFRKGFRSGEGEALAVVRPGTLLEQWQVLQACVAADKIVILQAANTGLTEGSTPNGTYDRGVVVINTRRMDGILAIDGGQQIISFPGATLFALEKLLKPLGRQPHSVIGSSCIGASIIGGVCNNSGGSLVERGPSYTELSLFAQISADGRLELINHLGIDLGATPEDILTRLQAGKFSIPDNAPLNRRASDTDYVTRLRDVTADTPARYNADKQRLFEAAGCAGKLAVFAVRLDTYANNCAEKVFYVGTNSPDDLTFLRRQILSQFKTLPVSAEYLHRDAFDIAERYGKDTVLMIHWLGTNRLASFFALKGAIDARLNAIPSLRLFTDSFLQGLSRLAPRILPKRMMEFRNRFEHHLILKAHDGGIDEAQALLAGHFSDRDGDWFACTAKEAKIAGLHRFAVAGAAVRYRAIHADEVEEIVALDIALKRNESSWMEVLPHHISEQMLHRLYYGHFLCQVFHQDYVLRKGVDAAAVKAAILALLDQRGAEYPAEHNVGHIYTAKPDLAAFYASIDPTNSMNPGIGKMSKRRNYADAAATVEDRAPQ